MMNGRFVKGAFHSNEEQNTAKLPEVEPVIPRQASLPSSVDTVSTIPADEAIPLNESDLGLDAKSKGILPQTSSPVVQHRPIWAFPPKSPFEDSIKEACSTMEGVAEQRSPRAEPGADKEGKTQLSTVAEDREQSGQNKSNASKMSLCAELKQKDSFGNPLRAIPSSKGRYQPIGDEDKSLQPINTKDEDENPSTGGLPISNEKREKAVKDVIGDSTTKQASQELGDNAKERGPGLSASTSVEKAEEEANIVADGSVKRDSLVATITVVTNLMKWQRKSKNQAGVKIKSMEKYKGHLEVIQRRSRQEQVELPFPIRLNIRREVLPIIHNVAKDYKLALGPHHRLTREAMAKEQQLLSELTEGDGVVL